MSGYRKYFENGGKHMSFMMEGDSVLTKCNEIWNKIKKTLNIKFHSMHVYYEKYIKVKVKEFNGLVNTKFLSGKIPNEGVHHTCTACISIDLILL